MAFWAYWKNFRYYHGKPIPHWIEWYKRQLYVEWFRSLPKEEQDRIIERKRQKDAEHEAFLKSVGALYKKLDECLPDNPRERIEASTKIFRDLMHGDLLCR